MYRDFVVRYVPSKKERHIVQKITEQISNLALTMVSASNHRRASVGKLGLVPGSIVMNMCAQNRPCGRGRQADPNNLSMPVRHPGKSMFEDHRCHSGSS